MTAKPPSVPIVFLTFAITLLFGLFVSTAYGATPERVALVIGNSAYEHVPSLENPANDATDLAAAFERLEFDVTLLIDQDDVGLRAAVRDFSKKARKADISVVYFAGHGIEIDKTNYLLPVNAQLQDEFDADFEAIQLSSLVGAVSGGNGVSLVLVDACRDNPFAQTLIEGGATRSIGQGLVRVNPRGGVLPGGVLIGYAAREGEFALDGEGRNSPYAEGLLRHLEEPGLEVSKLFRKVRDTVFKKTNGLQEPFTYGSLPARDIYFSAPTPKEQIDQLEDPSKATGLMSDYARAQRLDNVYLWEKFIKDHGDAANNALLAAARERLSDQLAEQAREAEKASRKPWLLPESGIGEAGDFDLTPAERRKVQESLHLLGFDTGGIDGNFGPKSLSAVFAARLLLGLDAGRDIDLDLLRRLPNPAAVESLRSNKAQVFKVAQLPANLEPRLLKAMTELEGARLLFGYFEGHLYVAVMANGYLSWSDINRRAIAAGGHLATIGSAAENRFLVNLFSDERAFLRQEPSGDWFGPAVGLFKQDTGAGPRSGWAWVNAEEIGYTNWPSEPPTTGGRHLYAQFYVSRHQDRKGDNVQFWGGTAGDRISGYIIEIARQ